MRSHGPDSTGREWFQKTCDSLGQVLSLPSQGKSVAESVHHARKRTSIGTYPIFFGLGFVFVWDMGGGSGQDRRAFYLLQRVTRERVASSLYIARERNDEAKE